MSDHYKWLMNPLQIDYLERPQPIDKLPFQKVWVIDNYLTPPIWHSWRIWRDASVKWGRSNRVIRDGEMQHLYWGESVYYNISERGWQIDYECGHCDYRSRKSRR